MVKKSFGCVEHSLVYRTTHARNQCAVACAPTPRDGCRRVNTNENESKLARLTNMINAIHNRILMNGQGLEKKTNKSREYTITQIREKVGERI